MKSPPSAAITANTTLTANINSTPRFRAAQVTPISAPRMTNAIVLSSRKSTKAKRFFLVRGFQIPQGTSERLVRARNMVRYQTLLFSRPLTATKINPGQSTLPGSTS